MEKPLWTSNLGKIKFLEKLAIKNKVKLYVAYNHRFEPHFLEMKKLISSKKLGKIYSCRMFYGNGTAKLIKNSNWRNKGSGVLTDLGSHLLDICKMWFGNNIGKFKLISANKFVINDKAKNTRVISIKILEKEVNIYFFEVLKIIL